MECSVCSQIAHRQCIKVIILWHSEDNAFIHYPMIAWFVLLFSNLFIWCSFLQEPGEGKINKDLPSCWECPKCYQGKDSSEVPTHTSHICIPRRLFMLILILKKTPFFFNPTHHPSLSFPHQSSSDEESEESEGSTSLPLSKLAYREGIGVGEGVRRGKRNRPAPRPTAPPPSQKLLLQHQQNRKRASALELRLKKRVRCRS